MLHARSPCVPQDQVHTAERPELLKAHAPPETRRLLGCAADKAAYVTSRTWHDSQRVEVMPDGAVRVSMRLPALGPVRSWMLEWGVAARALAPASHCHSSTRSRTPSMS